MKPTITDNQRIHVAPKRDWKLDRNWAYTSNDITPQIKPQGLWYSVGPSWIEWCEAEQFNDHGFVFELFFDVDKLLRLKSRKDLRRFTSRYLKSVGLLEDKELELAMFIDWEKVKQEHPYGIEIAPYNWRCRFEMLWYSGWDCASGCIWNLDVINGVKYFDEWKKDVQNETHGKTEHHQEEKKSQKAT